MVAVSEGAGEAEGRADFDDFEQSIKKGIAPVAESAGVPVGNVVARDTVAPECAGVNWALSGVAGVLSGPAGAGLSG